MQIHTKGVKLTSGMEEAILNKFNFLTKNFTEVKCFVASEPRKEIKLYIQFVDNYNHHFRAYSIGEFYSTLDELKAKVKRLISKRKTRNKLVEQEVQLEVPELTKEKIIYLDELSQSEANLKLDQLGHTFFAYKDVDTKQIQILYKKVDDTVGLIILK